MSPFAIPKIQYLNVTKSGSTTIGGYVITSMPGTSGISSEMTVRGPGIQPGTKVITVLGNSCTLSAPVSADGVGSFEFCFEVCFDYPPKEPKGGKIDVNETVSTSLSGRRQVSVNYMEEVRSLTLGHVSPTQFSLLENFFKKHALYGREFRYFEDKSKPSFVLYELAKLEFDPVKVAPRGVDLYVWDIPMQMRRSL